MYGLGLAAPGGVPGAVGPRFAPHAAVEDPQIGVVAETRPHGDIPIGLELRTSHDAVAGHFLIIGVQQQLFERSGQFLPLGRFIETGRAGHGLRVEVRVERFVDGFEVFQLGAEFHVEPLADHLEKLGKQLSFPRRQARVFEHLGLEGRRLDGEKVFPPVQELQAVQGSRLSRHDQGVSASGAASALSASFSFSCSFWASGRMENGRSLFRMPSKISPASRFLPWWLRR